MDRLDVYLDTRRIGALGHTVRLPLGVHRRSGKCYPFLDEQGKPLPLAKLSDALAYLTEAPRISSEHLAALYAQLTPADEEATVPRIDHALPQQSAAAAASSSTRSEVMRWVDAHVSPLELLEELAPASALKRAGQGWLGWCPFHDDRAAQADGTPRDALLLPRAQRDPRLVLAVSFLQLRTARGGTSVTPFASSRSYSA